jgi:hypothetical protein
VVCWIGGDVLVVLDGSSSCEVYVVAQADSDKNEDDRLLYWKAYELSTLLSINI